MAGKSDIEAGKAFVTLYVKNSALVKGMQVVKAELQSVGKAVMQVGGLITAMGSAITAPIGAAINQFVGMGTELQNVANKTGLGVTALGELKHAAEQTGAALGDIEGASKSVTKNIHDAAMGSAGAVLAFSRLGTSAASLKQMKPEDQLQTIAQGLAAIKDPAQQAALATQLLGGTNLLPMIGQLGALRKEARDLGLAPSEKAVADAANLGRTIKRSLSVVSAAIFEIGSAVAPTLFPVAEAIIRIGSGVTRWVRENGELIRTIARIGSIVVAVGTGVTAIGAAIFGLGTAFGMVASIATTVAGAFGSIITAGTALAALLAPLISPLGLVVLGIGGISAALVIALARWTNFTSTATKALGVVVEAIQPYVEIVKTTIGGIVDAFMSGNIGAAAEIAMTSIRLAFEVGKLAIVGTWLDLRDRILAVWDNIVIGATGAIAFVASLFKTLVAGFAATPLAQALTAGWEGFRIAAGAAFEYVLNYANAVISAINAVRNLIWKTVQDVAVAMPAVLQTTAVVAATGAASAISPEAVDMLTKAMQDSATAMAKVSEERGQDRKAREGETELWKQTQREIIAENRKELDRRAAEARAERDRLKIGGAGDVKPGGQRAADELVAGAALRQSTGSFSGLALQLGGNEPAAVAIQRRLLQEAREANEVAKKQEEHLAEGVRIDREMKQLMGMGA